MDSNLEQLVEKSVKVRDNIARTLTKNFPIEKDLADFLAMGVVNEAIGDDALARYGRHKNELALVKDREEARITWEYRKRAAKTIGLTGTSIIFALVILFYSVTGIYSCATASPYPRVYKPMPEHARFADVERSSWRGDVVSGLNSTNNLCVEEKHPISRDGRIGEAITCVHRNRVESLNQAMQRAVDTDFNGVVWNEANGNGEMWSVTRNNYRFVITATKDENYLDKE